MTAMPIWLDLMVAALLLSGAVFALLGSIGLLRFSDFMRRLHAPTKATTLGLGAMLTAAIVVSAWQQTLSLRELLISVLALATAPISAMLLARAALRGANTDIPPQPAAAETPQT